MNGNEKSESRSKAHILEIGCVCCHEGPQTLISERTTRQAKNTEEGYEREKNENEVKRTQNIPSQ